MKTLCRTIILTRTVIPDVIWPIDGTQAGQLRPVIRYRIAPPGKYDLYSRAHIIIVILVFKYLHVRAPLYYNYNYCYRY